MDGLAPLTADLRTELSVKRPHEYRQMQRADVDAAIAKIEENRKQEAARRAETTPSAEQLQQQLRRSRDAAYAAQRTVGGVGNT